MNGIITLTSDFGLSDPFVGVMKGQILTRYPEAKIVDLTHDILAHWPAEAGFWLARGYRYFPRGALHVAVVDPGVGTRREILLIESDGHVFMAPDNGLLAPLVDKSSNAKLFRLDMSRLSHLGIGSPSATFHGRDLFAPLAAEIASGRCRPASVGTETTQNEIVPAWVDQPVEGAHQVAGVVITIDHFGNLVTNIEAASIQRFKSPIVRTGAHEFAVSRTYGDRKPGEYLALVNSFGVVEIARAEQSAAEGLGVGRGAPVVVTDHPPQP